MHWSVPHLEQVGAAEEQEVDSGQRQPVNITQTSASQQRRGQGHLGEGVHGEVKLHLREEDMRTGGDETRGDEETRRQGDEAMRRQTRR